MVADTFMLRGSLRLKTVAKRCWGWLRAPPNRHLTSLSNQDDYEGQKSDDEIHIPNPQGCAGLAI